MSRVWCATKTRSPDRAGDGLDKADVDERRQIRVANVRAHHLTQLMANDLDGDGFVTAEEAMRVAAATLLTFEA